MELLADDVVVIARGNLIAAESMPAFLSRATGSAVVVRSLQSEKLAELLSAQGIASTTDGARTIVIPGQTTDRIGEIAFANGIALSELSPRTASLEQVFLELTESGQEYRLGETS
jgi:ABC-2 type transport system ATP-binding protein